MMNGLIRGVFASLAVAWNVDALLLSPQRKDPIRVITFGDSFIGFPGWLMLERMFLRHGVDARLKRLWKSDTSSCYWAKQIDLTVSALQLKMGKKVPDYMWLSLGVNDFDEREIYIPYKQCAKHSSSYAEARECMNIVRQGGMPCLSALVERFWTLWPDMKIYQNNYELPSWDGPCSIWNTRFPYCRMNVTCVQSLMREYALETIDLTTREWGHTGKYTHFYIAGTLQAGASSLKGAAGSVPFDASPGNPDITRGTPIQFFHDCGHIRGFGLGGWLIGEVLWNKYWSHEVVPTLTPQSFPRPRAPSPFEEEDGETDAEEEPDPDEWEGPGAEEGEAQSGTAAATEETASYGATPYADGKAQSVPAAAPGETASYGAAAYTGGEAPGGAAAAQW